MIGRSMKFDLNLKEQFKNTIRTEEWSLLTPSGTAPQLLTRLNKDVEYVITSSVYGGFLSQKDLHVV